MRLSWGWGDFPLAQPGDTPYVVLLTDPRVSLLYTHRVMQDNPLLSLRFEVPFDQIKPEHVQPAIQSLIAQADQELETIIGLRESRTTANTLEALDRLGETLWYAFRVVGHLEGVCTTPELRAAYNAALPAISAFGTKLQLSQGLYQALKDFAQTEQAQHLSQAQKRYLKLSLDNFRRQGADLPTDKKIRLEAINTRLSKITTQYHQNVVDSTAAWELYLSEAEVSGLPQSALGAARQSAKSKGKEGYRFTLQTPSYLAVMTYLDNPEIRQQMYMAYNNRATEEGWDNRPLLGEILALRREKAELLGYANFADYVLEDRMAQNAQTALRFEQDLREKYQPHFEQEKAQLQAFRQQIEASNAPQLQPWDVGYYAEKQRKALYDFDNELLRPYFPLPKVLEGLFAICGQVFGIEVEEIGGVPVWHPEVQVYDMRQDGQFIARFYTDWFPRETKRGGAWMNSLLTGNRANGHSEPHLGLMCGNLTPPIGDQPALLTHDEVQTIFHEFGHLLHHALSNVEVKSIAGTNVAWDFVELPSQIMENWTWEREALDIFARHYQTGEPIPQTLFEKMQQAKTYRAAHDTMRQLSFGTVDLDLHVHYTAAQGDITEYSKQVMQGFTPAPLPEGYSFITGFTHVFGAPVAYAAGYYSYKWAEVLDADAFSRFQSEGIFNPQTGADFIEHVLSKGNSVDPAELFRRFMGRDPDPRALLVRSGLLD